MAGKNQVLKEELEAINKGHTILPFIDYVDDLVNLSHGIITKPGGLTTTEVVASKKPIFVINPIPGQEEWNSRYILNEGLGRRIYNLDTLNFDIDSVLSNPLRVEYIEKMGQHLSHPKCLDHIYQLIKGLLDQVGQGEHS